MVASDGGAAEVKGLGFSPKALKLKTWRAALYHTIPDQGCLNCQCWELAKYAITVYLGVSPSLELNSFPCFLELINFNSTIMSPGLYTRKYHQDPLLWFPEYKESCKSADSPPTYQKLLKSLLEIYQFGVITCKMYALFGGWEGGF